MSRRGGELPHSLPIVNTVTCTMTGSSLELGIGVKKANWATSNLMMDSITAASRATLTEAANQLNGGVTAIAEKDCAERCRQAGYGPLHTCS